MVSNTETMKREVLLRCVRVMAFCELHLMVRLIVVMHSSFFLASLTCKKHLSVLIGARLGVLNLYPIFGVRRVDNGVIR